MRGASGETRAAHFTKKSNGTGLAADPTAAYTKTL